MLLSALHGSIIESWDLAAVDRLQSHTNWVYAVAVTPDGKQVVSASVDDTLKVWDIKTGKLQQTLNGHTNSSPCRSSDTRRQASGFGVI